MKIQDAEHCEARVVLGPARQERFVGSFRLFQLPVLVQAQGGIERMNIVAFWLFHLLFQLWRNYTASAHRSMKAGAAVALRHGLLHFVDRTGRYMQSKVRRKSKTQLAYWIALHCQLSRRRILSAINGQHY
ncbi:hypothetical protein [Variovorax paradoxus]|uniref:hypothetical protein n=1 Tax=Variovorax paradoxus TaxID=34073 RepID=UPI0018B041B1|nr:hypothetical protein [Variovorax paradoxus]